MQQKPNLDGMLHSPQAAEILKDKRVINDLMNSPDTKKLMELLKKTGGGQLQNAAKSAMAGDTAALVELMGRVMQNPEGAQAVEGINRSIPKK